MRLLYFFIPPQPLTDTSLGFFLSLFFSLLVGYSSVTCDWSVNVGFGRVVSLQDVNPAVAAGVGVSEAETRGRMCVLGCRSLG